MKMGVLGSGMVGQALGDKLAGLGHEVMIGTRHPEKLSGWHASHMNIGIGSFTQAAGHGELVFNATNGAASLEALGMAGESNLNGKVLIDVSNPLDFSKGFPPSLTICNTDSLGEQIQRAFPKARVVKTLNTVNCNVMVNPGQVAGGDHHLFVSGNDQKAKSQVVDLLKAFGWIHIIDLGDLTTARGVEMYLLLWVRLFGRLDTGLFNIKIMQ